MEDDRRFAPQQPETPSQAASSTPTGKLDGSKLYFSGFFSRILNATLWEETIVDELARPFIHLWEWVDQVGGFPGKVFFLSVVVMVVIGGLTWYSNKR